MLRLEQIYGAITYYLHNQMEIDAYLTRLLADFDRRAEEQAAPYPDITAKLRAAREAIRR